MCMWRGGWRAGRLSPHCSVCAPRVYWDLDIQTNAVIKHRGPSEVLPPHPEVELLRSQLILKLRQHYRELCQQREGTAPHACLRAPTTGSRGSASGSGGSARGDPGAERVRWRGPAPVTAAV